MKLTLFPFINLLARSLAILFLATIFLVSVSSQPIHAQSFAPSINGTTVSGPAATITSEVKIVLDPYEAEPIKRAVQDLQRDIEWVLGVKPTIVATVAELQAKPGIIVTGTGSSTASFRDTSLTGHENHKITVKAENDINHIVLQGSDTRGTIYAIYTFSDKFLGVPPLWYWSGWQPVKKTSITVPTDGGIFVGTPQTKYRAWFLNNQDLWLGWSAPAGVDKYDVLFETMLRLKLNTFHIGEQIGEYGGSWLERSQQAQYRGLQIAANDLAQFRQWNKYWTEIRGTTAPALTLANKAKFSEFWRYSLQYAKDNNLDVIWILGFRGTGDGGFWEDMSDAPTAPSARGDVIEEMTRTQMALVREVFGTQNEKMAFLIWNELTDLTSENNLQLPQDPDLIWIFGNDIRDHFPRNDALNMQLPSSQPYGYYMNLQFTSTGSHLVEGEGPWKAAQNFKLLQNRRPGGRLDFGYFNVGNVREFLLTSAVSSEMLWNIESYNPDTSMQQILGRYFGSANAVSLTTLYKRMMDGYYQQKANSLTNFTRQYIFHDLRMKEAIDKQLDFIRSKKRNLNPFDVNRLKIDPAYNKTSSQVGAVMTGSQTASSLFKTLVTDMAAAKNNISAASHPFYTDTFLAPAMFLRDAHTTLYHVTRSHFTVSSNISESYCNLKLAKDASVQMKLSLNQTAHEPFTTWYSDENIFGLTAIDTEIQQTLSTLPVATCSGSSTTPTPTPTRTVTPTPTRNVTPTPTRVSTPTPTQASLSQSAFTSTSGLSSSNIKDGKRTLIRTKNTIKSTQFACYNCGSAAKFVLYSSDSTGALKTQLFSGSANGVSSMWSYTNTTVTLTAGSYYVLQITPSTTPVYYGSTSKIYTDIEFLKYSTSGAPSWKTGSFQIRLNYTK